MKMKTSELTGAALDWAVAKCEGRENDGTWDENFSSNWLLGGPIIEKQQIEITRGNPIYFPKGNENGDFYEPLWIAGKQHGRTPLIAAMRFYVWSVLGDEIELPEELR